MNDVAKLADDDLLPEYFMGEAVLAEEILVKKMAVGAVADIMQQARDASSSSTKGNDGTPVQVAHRLG